MKKLDLTKIEQGETSGKQRKNPTKSKKSKGPEPLTKEQLEKLPKLPMGWKWVSHSQIATINPPKPNGDGSLEISFLPMPAVEEETGRYSLSETRKLGEVRKGYTGFIEGDVIFAKITPCMENGKVALLEKLVNGIGFGSTEFHVSRPTSSVSGKYLFHYLVQQMFRKEAKRSMTGSAGQLRVSTNYFAEQPFPLSPLPEQRAIVSKIEQLFSELDNGIANLKLAQEQLKVYRQAVLKKAFEGELTKKWREQQTDLSDAGDLLEQIRVEREENYNTKLEEWNKAVKEWEVEGKEGKKPTKPKKQKDNGHFKETNLAELPRLPEGWRWVKTAEIIDPINNGYTPKANFLSSGSGEVPFIKVYNLNFDGSFNFQKDPTFIPKLIHQKELARSVTYPGDVLINIVGPPLGKVSIVGNQFSEWNINQAIVLFRPNKWVTTKIISYYLQNPKTIQWLENTSKATAGQFNVKVSTCREIPFPLCSLSEQQAIVQEIETRLSVCDKIEQDIAEYLEKAEALRQSILKKAFEGKLLNEKELAEVRSADDWEPAEVLLERVKAERAKK